VKLPRLWLLALVALLPGRVLSAPLTFGHALERALDHNWGSGQHASGTGQAAGTNDEFGSGHQASERSCPVHLQDYAGIAARLASTNEMGLPAEGSIFLAYPTGSSPGAFSLRSRKSVVLCTALLFAELEGIQSEKLVLHQQQEYVSRLMDIESRRVSAEVDHPLLLTQAKLLRARTRMETAALESLERKTRAGLSGLTGLPLDQVEPVDDSMPPLPDELTRSGENSEVLRQLLAYRDVVQLDYVSEYINRLKVTHDMELAKTSIGNLVAAHITEEIKFIALLELNSQIRAAKIQFLGETDGLEAWALGQAMPDGSHLIAPPNTPESDSPASPGSLNSSAQTASLLSILVTPAIKELPVGKSQQFSAIATYSNGHAKDVTSEADWSCSSDTGALLSTTGLLTGLSVGAVAVHVDFQGLTHSRKLTITEQPVDEYLSRDHRSAIP
jgi:hypothetical protein